MHYEEAYNLYSTETTKVMGLRSVRLAAHVELSVVIINMYRILGVIPKGRSPQCRPRSTLEVNTEMDCDDVDCGAVDWIQLAEAMFSCGLLLTGLIKGVIILD